MIWKNNLNDKITLYKAVMEVTVDTAAMFLCTSYLGYTVYDLHPIKIFKQPVQPADCLHVYSSLYFIVSFYEK